MVVASKGVEGVLALNSSCLNIPSAHHTNLHRAHMHHQTVYIGHHIC